MHFLVDMIWPEVCGWIGATLVKIITFGRLDLDWDEGCTEPILAEWTHASDPARVPIPRMDFLQKVHV